MNLRFPLPALLLCGALAACGDVAAPTARSATPEGSAADVRATAQAIAVAMADPAVRADVRDAMRASLITQHRLVFAEYVASPGAARFVSAIAHAMRTDVAGARAMLGGLPDLDFFVPAREDRRSWEATANLAVVGLVQRPADGNGAGFALGGTPTLVPFNRRVPGMVIFQLSPPEFRDRRINPQPATPGTVIEDANDGVLSGRFTWTPAGGRPVTIQLAELHARAGGVRMDETCDPETIKNLCPDETGGGGNVPAPSDTTFLDYMYIHYADGCGDPDPSFIASFYNASGGLVGTGRLDYSEVPRHDDIYPHDPLIFNRITESTSEKINVRVVDRDSWFCGGDDEEGNRDFVASDRAQTRTIFQSSSPTVNVELDWTPKY